MVRVKRWLKRILIVLLILIILVIVFFVAFARPGGKIQYAINSPHGGDCVTQIFDPDEENLELAIIQRFFGFVYLHNSEPLDEEDIQVGWQMLPVDDGYIGIVSLFMERDYHSRRYVFTTEDIPLVSRIIPNTIPIYPTRWGVKVQNWLGYGDGHAGDIETVKLKIEFVGYTVNGELMYKLTEVKLKQHTGWKTLPVSSFECYGGSKLIIMLSQGGHTPYRNQLACHVNNYKVSDTFLGKVRISPDNCAYDKVVHIMIQKWQDVGDPGNLNDIFVDTPLGEQFVQESINSGSFCGGHRKNSNQNCQAKYEFIRSSDEPVW